MSQSSHEHANGSANGNYDERAGQSKPGNKFVSPDYQPAFERDELTEIRAPFWGIANHAMHEYFDERR